MCGTIARYHRHCTTLNIGDTRNYIFLNSNNSLTLQNFRCFATKKKKTTERQQDKWWTHG